MKRVRCGKRTILILRMALGAIFFFAGTSKMRRPAWLLEASVASFHLLPDAGVNVVAASLPFFEAIAGFWLTIGWRIRPAAFALLLLNLTYVVALAQALIRGLPVSCDCFGAELFRAMPLGLIFLRDFLLTAGSGLVLCSGLAGPARISREPPIYSSLPEGHAPSCLVTEGTTERAPPISLVRSSHSACP
jgi:putative oxidoreductase